MAPSPPQSPMPRLQRAAWGAAFLLLGCVLPFAAQRWAWAPVEVRVTNASAGHALEGLVLSSGDQREVVERLGAGEQRVLRFRGRGGWLQLDVQLPGEAQPREVRLAACCHAQVQLSVGGARAPELVAMPSTGFWAGLGAP